MKFPNESPYYSPHKCGLEIFDELDDAGSYEFNKIVVWKKLDDGTLWWDTDSGCSCPSPFDPADNGHDLKQITAASFSAFDAELRGFQVDISEYMEMREKVRKHLKSQGLNV